MPLTKQFPRGCEDWSALPFSDYVETKALAANTAEKIIVPDGAVYAVFSSDCDFVAKNDATAVVIADTTDGSGGVINPAVKYIKGVGYISVITAASGGGNVSVEFFKGPV